MLMLCHEQGDAAAAAAVAAVAVVDDAVVDVDVVLSFQAVMCQCRYCCWKIMTMLLLLLLPPLLLLLMMLLHCSLPAAWLELLPHHGYLRL